MDAKRKVAILLFDDVEVLDFAGPFEVFSVTGQRVGDGLLDVWTVAQKPLPVRARNGLSVNAQYCFADSPQPDILVVPGGYGTRKEMNNVVLTDWITHQAERSELVLSVCSGALLLAKAGLLEGLRATTHHGAMEELRLAAPSTCHVEEERIIDNGRIILSAGVSAGIDMAFHVVARLFGELVADETADYIEYRRTCSVENLRG
jgi:transcriptional regulator GlxA family with amidase domain